MVINRLVGSDEPPIRVLPGRHYNTLFLVEIFKFRYCPTKAVFCPQNTHPIRYACCPTVRYRGVSISYRSCSALTMHCDSNIFLRNHDLKRFDIFRLQSSFFLIQKFLLGTMRHRPMFQEMNKNRRKSLFHAVDSTTKCNFAGRKESRAAVG